VDRDRQRQRLREGTTAQALTTVDVSATTPATLYPGATGNVKLSISNPNPYPVTVSSSGNGAITSDKGAACNITTGVTHGDQTGSAWSFPRRARRRSRSRTPCR
jgi:hypothetical protein